MVIGRLYIHHRQMRLEFPTGVTRRVIDSLFPSAEIVVEEETYRDNRDLILKARIVSYQWTPMYEAP